MTVYGHYDELTAQDTDYVVWDDKLTGFGIKVTPTGRKTYVLKYRTQEGAQRKPTVGVHGKITCEEARQIAKEWLGDCAKGQDPSTARQTMRRSPTVAELCDRFMAEHVKIHKKPKSIWLDNFYVEKYIKPRLGSLKVLSVAKADSGNNESQSS